jgi:hypothetical protein
MAADLSCRRCSLSGLPREQPCSEDSIFRNTRKHIASAVWQTPISPVTRDGSLLKDTGDYGQHDLRQKGDAQDCPPHDR